MLLLHCLIGNGQITNFWTDPWLNGGRLKDRYGEREIYALGMGADIMVSRFLHNNCWHLPRPTTNALKDIFQGIPSEIVPWPMFDDEIVWTLEEQGHFSLKSSYKLIYNIPNQQLQWTSAIWFKGCIKKTFSLCLDVFTRKTQNKGFPS